MSPPGIEVQEADDGEEQDKEIALQIFGLLKKCQRERGNCAALRVLSYVVMAVHVDGLKVRKALEAAVEDALGRKEGE